MNYQSNTPKFTLTRRFRLAFTLVEMLVAMAVTLLMIAGLARGFAFVGERVRDSRAEVGLSDELRDITTRVSDELSRCTVSMIPNVSEEDSTGYFMYYEGPVTDATSSLFRAQNDSAGNLELNDMKYGDFDDYLAFTAAAPPGSWFYGKVPRYVLDQKTIDILPVNNDASTSNDVAYSSASFPGNPWDPIMIRSKFAEIVYFASPEYLPASLPVAPAYIDVDGDVDFNGDGAADENGIPDRLKLHRRVLLIRPDLNLNSGFITPRSIAPTGSTVTVNFMKADTWPSAASSEVTTAAASITSSSWLYGMAQVHQQCDLSVRRVLAANGEPAATGIVAANSLSDLAKPHNRFAHVRVPSSILTGAGGTNPSSMPVLALGAPATILNALAISDSARLAPPLSDWGSPSGTPQTSSVVTPSQMSGFLRPEFILGHDLIHHDSPTDSWGLERLGEDLLTNNGLSFDVKIYDPEVSSFVMNSTNNLVVGPNDAGYREALQEAISQLATRQPSTSPIRSVDDIFITSTKEQFITRMRGGFVDLCYPALAGGTLRGYQPRRIERRSTTDDGRVRSPDPANEYLNAEFLITPYSGFSYYAFGDSGRPNPNANTLYTECLYKSGKVVTYASGAGSPGMRIFQPTFDTFSSCYERDGFLQGTLNGRGARWSTVTTPSLIDLGTDGLDNNGYAGADDQGEAETCPPFPDTPEAIRVTFRLENPSTRQIRQASVVHRD